MIPQAKTGNLERAAKLAAANDPVSARTAIEAAVAEGDARASVVYAGFLAGGIGGPRDWQGAVALLRERAPQDPFAARQVRLIEAMDLAPDGAPVQTPAPAYSHPDGRLQLFNGFLTADECDFLMALAKPRLRPAGVVEDDGIALQKEIRDADTAVFLPLAVPAALHAISRRIAAITETDERQGQPFQIMRYAPGQQYRTHLDAVRGAANNRILTTIAYLNEGYGGGETSFPGLDLRVQGEAGDLLLFRNLLEDGDVDPDMRHAGLPVTAGVKFIMSRWILERPAYDEVGRLGPGGLWG
jgi:prolyl 4-hydroxylase